MNIFQVLVLSVVEGVTEFLPISSTGHLIMASNLLGIVQTEFVKSFTIVIQFGAILAVVVLYFSRVIKNFKIWGKILAAFLPTALIGFGLYEFIKASLLGNLLVDVMALLIGGVVIIVLEKYFYTQKNKKKIEKIERVGFMKSLLIGAIQSISVIPGVSRAGATIFGGMGLGLSRVAATEFSFLLAVPTMFAATTLDLFKTRLLFDTNEYFLMAVGFVGSFIAALLTIKMLVNFVKSNSFVVFGVYRIVIAILFLFFIL